jgi:prepilin signal peptidase PulO-like enzyme (type II secretory pathway)
VLSPAYGFVVITAAVAFLGLALGSFASALAFRVPRDMAWGKVGGKMARSQCPFCAMSLNWQDMIPIVSWILLRGKCRYCSAKIGKRYIILEIASLALCLAIYASYGLNLDALLAMASVPFLLAIGAKDNLSEHAVPMQLLVFPALAGAFFQHDILMTYTADEMFAPAVLPRLVVNYVVAMISYAAVCLLYAWFLDTARSLPGATLSLATFGAMSGLWLELYLLAFFLMVVFIAHFVVVVSCKSANRKSLANMRIIWSVSVIAFYSTLLVQGNLAATVSLINLN